MAEFDYEYPEGIDLRPESDIHKDLVTALENRIRRGREAGRDGRSRGRELDRTLQAFIPAKAREDLLKFHSNRRKPDAPLEIVIPVSKAALDTWVTYMAGAFLANPLGLYQLQGRGGPQGIVRAALHERFLNTQALWFRHDLSHITCWRDAFTYGTGCIGPAWSKHVRREPVQEEVTDVVLSMVKDLVPGLNRGDVIKILEDRIVHEGNELLNVDYYSLILDPGATIHESHKFEYAGFIERSNIMDLLAREDDPEEELFNVQYLREKIKGGQGMSKHWHGRGRKDSAALFGAGAMGESTACDVIHLYWKLIPSEWGLGDGDRPELHRFLLGADETIISWKRMDFDHGRLPMLFAAPNSTGYDTFPVSALANTYGGQQYCDWKVRAQIANQSKVLNDMILIDPSMFEEKDMMDPQPGKLIRAKRSLYGQGGLQNYVQQLQVHNVTGQNLADVGTMIQMIQQGLGTVDIVQGDLSGLPDRPTAQGLMAARNSALSRLQKDAQILISQVWYDLIHMMASNTMQYMSQDVMLSIVGTRYEQDIRTELGLPEGETDVMLTPWSLDLNFDVQPVSKLMADGDLQAMGAIIDRMLAIPDLAMQALSTFNLPGMLTAFVRRSGFSNIHEFVKSGHEMPDAQAMTMEDEMLMQQVDAGSMIPADEAFM